MHVHHLDLLHTPRWTEKRELFTSLTIQAFGISMVQIFLPIYVLRLGYDFQAMCLLFLVQNIIRIPFHLLSMKAIKVFGVKHSLSAGYFMNVAGFIAVSFGTDSFTALLIGLALIAMGDSFYWNPRHIMSAQLFNKSNRGKNVSMTMILIYIAAALGPLAGGFIGEQYGLSTSLIVAAVIITLACLPLLATKDLVLPKKATKKVSGRRIPTQHHIACLASNFEIKSAGFLWPVFIYLLLGSLSTVGLIFAVGILVTVGVTRTVGRLSDKGFGKTLVLVGSLGASVAHIAKIFVTTVGGAYAATLLYSSLASLKTAPYAASLYKNARDYGTYDYIKYIQLTATAGNVLMWAVAYMLALYVQPRLAIIIVFCIAAAITPLQSLINQPIIKQNIFQKLLQRAK